MGHLTALARRLLDAILVAGRPRTRWRQRLGVLALGVVVITAWQVRLAAHPERLDATYKIAAAAHEAPTQLDREQGRVHLFQVDRWLGGDAQKPSLKPANELGFILALDLLFLSAWWIDWSFLGAILVLFFGSNPLQLYAAYAEESYSSWPITALVLLLAINLPLLAARPRARWLFVAAALSGLVLAAIQTWQSDAGVLILSAVAASALASGIAWRQRVAAVLVSLLVFAGGYWLHEQAIAAKTESAETASHDVWHRAWCGLGDFDPAKGHECQTAKRTDPATARAHVLGDIRREPLGYAGILAKRARRILTEVTPIEIAISESKPTGTASLFGWLALPLALVLHRHRRGFFTKLILFPLPLAIVPLVVDSGGGLVLFSSFHIVAAAVVVLLVVSGARARLGRGRFLVAVDPATP